MVDKYHSSCVLYGSFSLVWRPSAEWCDEYYVRKLFVVNFPCSTSNYCCFLFFIRFCVRFPLFSQRRMCVRETGSLLLIRRTFHACVAIPNGSLLSCIFGFFNYEKKNTAAAAVAEQKNGMRLWERNFSHANTRTHAHTSKHGHIHAYTHINTRYLSFTHNIHSSQSNGVSTSSGQITMRMCMDFPLHIKFLCTQITQNTENKCTRATCGFETSRTSPHQNNVMESQTLTARFVLCFSSFSFAGFQFRQGMCKQAWQNIRAYNGSKNPFKTWLLKLYQPSRNSILWFCIDFCHFNLTFCFWPFYGISQLFSLCSFLFLFLLRNKHKNEFQVFTSW